MDCEDWRDTPTDLIAPLLAAEHQRWLRHLSWDLGPALHRVEQARVAGELPGMFVRSRTGDPLAWSYYVLRQGILRICALTGRSAGALRLMLDRISLSAEAQLARALSCFVFPTTTSVASALARQRFALEPRRYMSLPLSGCEALPGVRVPLRPWVVEDAPPTIRLLARAYTTNPDARCFAHQGRLEEWAHYVGRLLNGADTGTFEPAWSFVAESSSHELAGVVLCTRVAPETAHIAQVAADPANAGGGLGTSLVATACEAAARAGVRRVTLLVGEQNVAAHALCARLGFLASPWTFLYAHRGPIARRLAMGADDAAAADGHLLTR